MRRLAVLDTTTTVLTLTLTGLAADSWLAGRSPRAGRRVAAVGLMAGALVGALAAARGSGSAGKSVPFALALTAEEAEAAEGVAVQPDGRSQVASGDPGGQGGPPGWPAITVSAEVCCGQGTKTSLPRT